MITFAEGVAQAARGTLCALMAANDNVNRLFANIGADPFGFYPAMSGLRRQLCSDDPNNDPSYEPPFEGGQCNDVYVIQVQTTRVAPNPPETFSVRARGPIGGVRVVPITPPAWAVQLNSRGQSVGSTTCGTVLEQSQAWRNLVAGTAYTEQSASIVSITPCGLDDCGDIAPVIGPPGDVIVEGDDITYNIDESTEITVPISFVFAPAYVDLDGSVTVPVNIDVGGIEFSGTVEIAPEFNLTIKPKGLNPSPGAPDDPDEIGEPGEPSTPIDDEEELESTIVGVLVYSDIDPDGLPSSILFPDGPNIYVPRLASVQFAVKTQNSIGWTPDQDVKNLECYVPCPAPQGAIAVRVSPMPGVTSRFTPVRGLPLTSF